MRGRSSGASRAYPTADPRVIERWTPRLRVRAALLFTPVVVGPLQIWLIVTEPEEFLLTPWVLAWLCVAAVLAWMSLTAFRARVVLRGDGVAIREAVRDRVVTWDHLHGAVAHWGGLRLQSYEPWSSDFDRHATGGVIVEDWRRPWRLRKRSQPAADRINEEIARRGAGAPPGASTLSR